MTLVRHSSPLPPIYAALHDDSFFPVDLRIACLWSALGLTLSGLFFVMGFGADVAQALMAAG